MSKTKRKTEIKELKKENRLLRHELKVVKKELFELKKTKTVEQLKNSKIPILFTDGGFSKEKEACVWAFGTEDEVIDSGLTTKLDGTWQIQGEVMACVNAIKYADKQGYEKVIICHDLEGLSHWYEGHWKANFPSTKELKELKNKVKVKVSFNWVKGHIGIKGNELVDSRCGDLLKNYEDLTKSL